MANTRKNRRTRKARKSSRKTHRGGNIPCDDWKSQGYESKADCLDSQRGGQRGGKRKMSSWNKTVKRVYEEMKRKDRKASFSDALKEASRRKKAGNL